MKIDRPDDFIIGAMDSCEKLIDFVCARDAQVLQALGFALAHADPFPMLRGLAEDLGGEVRACSRCGDALGAEEIGGTCELPTPSRARLIVDGHSVMCAEFGGEGPMTGCPGCALPPRSLSAQVRARLGNGDLSLLMSTSRPAIRLFSATWHREYQDGVVSDRRDAEGQDVDACLRAVLAWEDSADREQPEHAPPAVPGPTEESLPALRARVERLRDRLAGSLDGNPMSEVLPVRRELAAAKAELDRRDAEPGPTEHVDMALRFRYRYGGFVVQSEHSAALARPDHYYVHGLAIRIVYEHSAADAEAAQDCAESWRSRMLGAGAREVECVGEVEK